jgi:hypothetical protein
VEQGRVVFPISDSIYAEISKIRQHRQRRDLRQVIEKVSRYMVVTSRSVVSTNDIEALLDCIVGPNPKPTNTMNYLDWGVARAFRMAGGFRVRSSTGEDVSGNPLAVPRRPSRLRRGSRESRGGAEQEVHRGADS